MASESNPKSSETISTVLLKSSFVLPVFSVLMRSFCLKVPEGELNSG